MTSKRNRQQSGKQDLASQNFQQGLAYLQAHPMFQPLLGRAFVRRSQESNLCPRDGWAVVTANGVVYVHPTRRGTPEEWMYVLAHCLLHLGFGHFQVALAREVTLREWNAACDCYIAKFLADLKLGRPPEDLQDLATELRSLDGFSLRTEERLYSDFCERGIPEHLVPTGTGGAHANDMIIEPERVGWAGSKTDWQAVFGAGLAQAVTSAVDVAAGLKDALTALGGSSLQTEAQRARTWFINHYPLLGSLATAFHIIEDPLICQRLDISVAAVDVEAKEIFMNPAAGLGTHECRFVMAHELLHVGLRHDARRRGRDPYLWNVACDYVINGWLIEMGLGELPKIGALYDPAIKGESAEAIYDRIVTDMRQYRKLATLRGVGLSDILEPSTPDWWSLGDGMSLDDFYRRCLSQGLEYHHEQGRGFLPGGLEEEIRALSQPPIAWDVELARWFDDHFSPIEKVRTYARPNRHQSATPDIPRPSWVPAFGSDEGRTFGVLLDTSGSMDRTLLAKALGAIASYSISRDVPAVRVVFCDAATYDQGYMLPEAIAERVKVRGRGGTILQPGVALLEYAEDFPKQGPLLIITDGKCDRLHIKREHAFLVPEGRDLPFVPRGQVFRIR